MTDDDLDDLIRQQAVDTQPDSHFVEALVSQAQPRSPWWPRIAVGFAVAAVALLASAPLLVDAVTGDDWNSAAPMPAPEVPEGLPIPDGHRLLTLGERVRTGGEYADLGDRVDLLVTLSADGDLEVVTLATDVPVIGVDPLDVALEPPMVEKIVHGMTLGDLTVAVATEAGSQVVIRPRNPVAMLGPGMRVDVLLTHSLAGEHKTQTLVEDLLVVDVPDDDTVRVATTRNEAETLVLAQSIGDITLTRR